MATKSINHKDMIWSVIAIIFAIISVAYCIQAFLQSSSVDLSKIFTKFKMLGVSYIG